MTRTSRRRRQSPAKKKDQEDFNAGDSVQLGGITYQLRWILCGKPNCKRKHGPYWYAFWKYGGKTRARYVGKNLPPDVLDFGRQ